MPNQTLFIKQSGKQPAPRGAVQIVGNRPHLMIIDDPYEAREAATLEQKAAVTAWFEHLTWLTKRKADRPGDAMELTAEE